MPDELDFSRIMPEKEALERYHSAAHAMQSGVALEINYDDTQTSPKHLRVGINSSMVDTSSLAELLIHKGVITSEEYLTAIALGMEREKRMYQDRLRERFPNTEINLV